MYEAIDSLPGGVEWKREEIVLKGDVKDGEGQEQTEVLELWFRDPVECVKELMGNPMFRDVLEYALKRVWLDEGGTKEVVDEMSSAGWWWKMQVSTIEQPDGFQRYSHTMSTVTSAYWSYRGPHHSLL